MEGLVVSFSIHTSLLFLYALFSELYGCVHVLVFSLWYHNYYQITFIEDLLWPGMVMNTSYALLDPVLTITL